MRVITLENVIAAGDAVVVVEGERENPGMQYSAPCLVGRILQQLGVDIEPIILTYDNTVFSVVPWSEVGIRFEQNAARVLETAQREADANQTWDTSWDRGKASA